MARKINTVKIIKAARVIYKPQSENFKEVQLLCKNFVKVLRISGVFCKNMVIYHKTELNCI